MAKKYNRFNDTLTFEPCGFDFPFIRYVRVYVPEPNKATVDVPYYDDHQTIQDLIQYYKRETGDKREVVLTIKGKHDKAKESHKISQYTVNRKQ